MKRLLSPVTSVTLDVRWSLLPFKVVAAAELRKAGNSHAACGARACPFCPSGRCMLRQLDDTGALT